jgi:hypothetical protein
MKLSTLLKLVVLTVVSAYTYSCVNNDSSANVRIDVPKGTDVAKLASISVVIYQSDNVTSAAKPIGVDTAVGDKAIAAIEGALVGSAIPVVGPAAGAGVGLVTERALNSKSTTVTEVEPVVVDPTKETVKDDVVPVDPVVVP